MNGYNFTNNVRVSLQKARESASRLHHEYVGTEHELLGLLQVDGVALAVLIGLGVDPSALKGSIETAAPPGKGRLSAGPDLPYTSGAKRVLELAMTEARELDHTYVGTEHLLLGLLRERRGIAAKELENSGVELEKAREVVLRMLGAADPEENKRLLAQAAERRIREPSYRAAGVWPPARTSLPRLAVLVVGMIAAALVLDILPSGALTSPAARVTAIALILFLTIYAALRIP